jgi:hypothetical protein
VNEWHSRGHGFDPHQLHQFQQQLSEMALTARPFRVLFWHGARASREATVARCHRRRWPGSYLFLAQQRLVRAGPTGTDHFRRSRAASTAGRCGHRRAPPCPAARAPSLSWHLGEERRRHAGHCGDHGDGQNERFHRALPPATDAGNPRSHVTCWRGYARPAVRERSERRCEPATSCRPIGGR